MNKMESDTTVRIANLNDIEGIVELQKHVYPHYKRDKPFFTWQCFEGINPSVLIVAQQENSIVGMCGIQKIKTTINLCGGQLSWIVVDEQKRRNGFFAKMGKLALECMPGLDFIFIFANKEAVPPCEKAFGLKFIGNLYQLVSTNSYLDVYAEYYMEPINIKTEFNNNSFCEKTITFSRTECYRRWRYANSTVYKYFKVSILSGEYAIIKLFNEKQSSQITGDIVDFDCNVQDILKLHSLFYAASAELRKMGATIISTLAVPGSKLRCLLGEMGFAESDHGASFGINVFNQKYNHLYNFNSWHLVQSDASNY